VEGKARVALRTNPDLRRGKFEIDCRNITPDAAPGPAPAPTADAPEVPVAPLLTAVPSAFDRPPAVLSLPSGERIELHEGHYVLGRHLENDIVLNDTNVSRKHAEFVCAAGEVVVRDLGSTNGTKVNGVLITGEQLLQHGDVVNFGTAQVRFEAS
jgi:pSer/pThr/pTyr-binding forkhead associated (FHA) protein